MITKVQVTAEIKNMSDYGKTHEGYIVVRRDDDASLWYYGLYDSEEDAKNAAIECGNGFVLEQRG